MQHAREELWREDEPSYNRTWDEIETLLFSAINEMNAQRAKFQLRKNTGPKEATYRALMKYQRAKGIVIHYVGPLVHAANALHLRKG